jgi:hypothetical protein
VSAVKKGTTDEKTGAIGRTTTDAAGPGDLDSRAIRAGDPDRVQRWRTEGD